jgi:hypothetical protein
MNPSIRRMAAAAAACIAWSSMAFAAEPTIKIVYHVNEGLEKSAVVLHNVKNNLDAEPGAKIVVVGHGAGIDFMLDGAKDKNGNPFDATIDTLQERGVEFRVCNNTLKSRHIDPKRVIPEATIVPSGVAEIARLESKGYVYLKP